MKISTHLQILSLCILISGAGLLYIPSLNPDPFEYPKALFFIATTATLTILNLIHWGLNQKKISLKTIPTSIKLAGVILITEILAFALSQDYIISLIGAPYRLQGLIAEMTIIIYLLNATYIFINITKQNHWFFFAWLMAITTISGIIGLIPYIIDTPFFNIWDFQNRAFGTFGNPNYFAVFLISTIPFFGLFLTKKSNSIKLLSLTGLLISITALSLTGCRSAWIALIFGLLMTGITIAVLKKKYKILLIAIATIAITGSLLTFQQFHNTQSLSRLSLTKDNLGSVATRLYLQKAGIKLFTEHPLFGSGQETIAGAIEPYLPEYLKSNDIFYIDRTHNEFLDILITQGIVGFLAYSIFWLYLMWKTIQYLIRSNDQIAILATISIIAIHVYYAANFATISSNILLYTIASYLIAVTSQKAAAQKR